MHISALRSQLSDSVSQFSDSDSQLRRTYAKSGQAWQCFPFLVSRLGHIFSPRSEVLLGLAVGSATDLAVLHAGQGGDGVRAQGRAPPQIQRADEIMIQFIFSIRFLSRELPRQPAAVSRERKESRR